MSDSKIQWCDKVWNPVRGCSRVSSGCDNCYAMGQAHRFSGPGLPYDGLTVIRNGKVDWKGQARFIPEKLAEPLKWKKPCRIFVASMSDPFHSSIPDGDIDKIFAAMVVADWHQYQLLTKRPKRMLEYLKAPGRAFAVTKAIDALEVDWATAGTVEEWRQVPSHPKYEVSNFGHVRRGGRELTLVDHGGGYKQVALSNGRVKTVLVHRLVLGAFDRPPLESEEAAHRNGIRHDNRIANLRWASKDENMQDATRHGTAGVWMRARATLSEHEVRDVRLARSRGEKLTVVASRYGITKQQVSAIALGKIFKPAPIPWPLPNVWLGVSAEDQKTADERIPLLLQCPAAIHWVSAEPLLGPIDFELVEFTQKCRPDWIVVGGESGPGARECRIEWIRSVVAQCKKSEGVLCFVKQMGSNAKAKDSTDMSTVRRNEWASFSVEYPIPSAFTGKGSDPNEWAEELRVREFPEATR